MKKIIYKQFNIYLLTSIDNEIYKFTNWYYQNFQGQTEVSKFYSLQLINLNKN